MGKGSLVAITRVELSGAVTVALPQRYWAPWFILMLRSSMILTPPAVIVAPLWNFTPERSLKVQVRPSSLTDQEVASEGSSLASLVL